MIRLDSFKGYDIPIQYNAELAKAKKTITLQMISAPELEVEVPPEIWLDDYVPEMNRELPEGMYGYNSFDSNDYFKNQIGHDFFNRSADFLYERAQSIAKDGAKWDGFFANDVTLYANRALEFFGGYSNETVYLKTHEDGRVSINKVHDHTPLEETIALKDQLVAAVEEWGKLLETDKNADISQVKTKLNVKGMEMSLADLVNTQKALKNATDSVETYGNFYQYAKFGLSLAETKRFTQQELSPELGDKIYSLMEDRIWNTIDRFDESCGAANVVSKTDVDVYYFHSAAARGGMKGDILTRFANIDGSSEESFVKGFKEAIEWYKDKKTEWGNATHYRKDWLAQGINDDVNRLIRMYGQMGHVKSINVLV